MVVPINYNSFITDNFFDSGTIDGSSTDTIFLAGFTDTVFNNIGQTNAVSIGAGAGTMAFTWGDNLANPNSLLYLESGNASGSALIGPYKDGLRFSSAANPAFMYVSDTIERGIIWAIPLNEYVPLGTYITQVVIVAYATVKFSHNSVLQTFVNNAIAWTGTGSESTPLTYDFGSTGSYLGNTHITLTIDIPYGSVRVHPDFFSGKFPHIIMHGSPFSDASGGQFFINPVQVTYRW